MLKITAMPMIGQVQHSRLNSLQSCHAITERQVVVMTDSKDFDRKLGEAVKELVLSDRTKGYADGKLAYIIQLEFSELGGKGVK